jgi:hypothetical protein
MKYHITLKQLIKQLKYDLIGKDSYRGVTLTYSWLANQFGHFSLGFVPCFFLYQALKKCTHWQQPGLYATLIIATAWLLFELYNFLGPLLHKTSEHAKKNATGNYTFAPAWGNIAYDTATDVCFFWIGAFTMGNAVTCQPFIHYTHLILIVLVLYPSYNWYTTKMYQQAANYPFQYRLSQWNLMISDANKTVVKQFINQSTKGKHLLVFGENKTGKTSLCVAIANELSIQHHSCSYTTAMKLFSLFFEPPIDTTQATCLDLWTWQDASLLIIDDINPGLPVSSNLVSPQEFYSFLDNQLQSEANKKALKDKSVIWVLGNQEASDNKENNWAALLQQIGVNANDIASINLSA